MQVGIYSRHDHTVEEVVPENDERVKPRSHTCYLVGVDKEPAKC